MATKKKKEEYVTIDALNKILDNRFKVFDEAFTKRMEHYIGVVMEDNRRQIKMLAEGIAMQIEMGQKRWEEQSALNALYEWRIKALESAKLT
jgi:hypothetical protein